MMSSKTQDPIILVPCCPWHEAFTSESNMAAQILAVTFTFWTTGRRKGVKVSAPLPPKGTVTYIGLARTESCVYTSLPGTLGYVVLFLDDHVPGLDLGFCWSSAREGENG